MFSYHCVKYYGNSQKPTTKVQCFRFQNSSSGTRTREGVVMYFFGIRFWISLSHKAGHPILPLWRIASIAKELSAPPFPPPHKLSPIQTAQFQHLYSSSVLLSFLFPLWKKNSDYFCCCFKQWIWWKTLKQNDFLLPKVLYKLSYLTIPPFASCWILENHVSLKGGLEKQEFQGLQTPWWKGHLVGFRRPELVWAGREMDSYLLLSEETLWRWEWSDAYKEEVVWRTMFI